MTTNLVNEERETFIDIQNINPRRIDELIEDAEIEAEIEAERRIRAKNTRIASISIVSIVLLVFLYAGMQNKTGSATGEETVTKVVRAPLKTEANPIPFPVNDKSPEKIASAAKSASAQPEAPKVKPADTASAKKPPEPAKKETPTTTAAAQKTVESKKAPAPSKFEAKRVSPPVTQPKPAKAVKAAPAAPKPKVSKPAPSSIKRAKPAQTASAGIRKEYFVQVGAFSVRENAEYKSGNLKAKGFLPSIKEKRVEEKSHTVMISGFSDIKYGQIQVQGLKSSGFSPTMKKNSDNTYSIVLGNFDTDQKARELQRALTDKGYFSTIQKELSEKVIYQVQLGKFSSEEKAKSIQDVLQRSGFTNSFLRAAETL